MHGVGSDCECRGHRAHAHRKHAKHGCDAGSVEAQRLVEHRRVLPSRKEGVRCGARCCAGRQAVGRQAVGRGWAGGARECAERTKNMYPMSVTLDVSKLSGWLKTDAYCRVERERAYTMRAARCGPECGRACGVAAVLKRHARRGVDSRLGGQGTGGAHMEHEAHGCDAGSVEAQRLVERPRVLPSRVGKKGIQRQCGHTVRAGRRERALCGAATAQTACTRRDQPKAGGRARVERTLNIPFMFVTPEVSKSSGWLKAVASCRVESRAYGVALPSVERRAYDAANCAGREAVTSGGLDCRFAGAGHGEERT